jgi:DMSO/TMAO reductase YedYZ molybdopterin-dependent catalytic subunit
MASALFRRGWRWVESHPPPGPFRPGFFRSPIRGPWLTAVLGLVLLVGIPVVFLTGLASYLAYKPDLIGGANDLTADKGLFGFYLEWFDWPASVSWLFRLNQGVHVVLGLALVPVVLGKLWSVLPKFFVWPPFRNLAELLERITLFFLVGGIVFQLVTGVLNIQYWYVFPAGFYRAHLYGAWVFMAAFVLHAALRVGVAVRTVRDRGLASELRVATPATLPEPFDPHGLVSADPAPATISRRGALGLIGGASALVVGLSAGQTISDRLRPTALLAPRGGSLGRGANAFPVNKTAASAGVLDLIGADWRLTLENASGETKVLRLDDLEEMEQHTYELPLACVEGWSTVQTWSGVRLRDLARLAGEPAAPTVVVQSVQEKGTFRVATLRGNQIADERSLLALRVNGEALSADHGFPARVIVPGNPGVHNTKWVGRMTFRPNPEPEE